MHSGRLRFLKLPPSSVCNKVIDSASCSSDPVLVEKATDLAEALQLQAIGILPRTAGSLVSSLAGTGSMGRGIKFLDNWISRNSNNTNDDNRDDGPSVEVSYVLTCALEAAARSADPEAVTAILGRMATVGMSPQPHSMHLLIQCFMRKGLIDTAYDIIKWMRRSGLSPTIQCYTALLTLPSRQPSHPRVKPVLLLSRAKHAYSEMKEHGVRANLPFYLSFLSLCGHARDVSCAMELWADMLSQREISLDVKAYNTIIDVCGKCGDEENAYAAYLELQKTGSLEPDTSTISKLLPAIRKFPRRLDRVWDDAIKQNIPLDVNVWRSYIGIVLERSRGVVGTAGSIIRLLEKADDSVAPCLYQIAIMSAVHDGNMNAVKEYAEAIRSRRPHHTLGLVTALLFARSRQKSFSNSQKGKRTSSPCWKSRMVDTDPPTYLAIDPDSRVIDALLCFDGDNEGDNPNEPGFGPRRKENESSDAELVRLGLLCVDGHLDEAFDLYEQVCLNRGMLQEPPAKLGWMLHALLAASRCASYDEQQKYVLRTITLSRRLPKQYKQVWWWDAATQRNIVKLLKQFPDMANVPLSLAPNDEGERIQFD
jgi:pentatricopeptide repeat protein